MGMGQRVRTGLGHGGITYVLQTQFSVVVFFFGGGGWGGAGEHENNFKEQGRS